MDSTSNTPDKTSGFHESYWSDSTENLSYQALQQHESADVVIVGAGISGLSVAYRLTKAGKKVIVLEDGMVGSGETGRTTAHLSNALDDRYYEIAKTFGDDMAKLAAHSHTVAIDFIEQVVKQENIDCDFQRVPGYLFLHPSDQPKSLEDEFEATRKAGIATELVPSVPGLHHYSGTALKFPGQATFHPMKYINALARIIVNDGGRIYGHTKVTEVAAESVIANDVKVLANQIVVATNSPINDLFTMHTKQHPYRTYVVAAEIPKGSLQPALWWDTGDMGSMWVSKPYHYVRIQPFNALSDLLIVGGEDHKTGQATREDIPEEERYDHLEQWARKHFPMITNIAYTWSGQVMEPVDMMGFIGKNPGDDNIYIATGDSGNGMTHGTIAGLLISDLILGNDNPWVKLYDPSRITFSTANDFVKEAGNMAVQYLDYFTPGEIESVHKLSYGEGAVMRTGVKKVAVYKDPTGKISAYSAVCPHLGCYVRWNKDEKSFDCPCHGSRFNCEGKVQNGPAVKDLEPLKISMESLKK